LEPDQILRRHKPACSGAARVSKRRIFRHRFEARPYSEDARSDCGAKTDCRRNFDQRQRAGCRGRERALSPRCGGDQPDFASAVCHRAGRHHCDSRYDQHRPDTSHDRHDIAHGDRRSGQFHCDACRGVVIRSARRRQPFHRFRSRRWFPPLRLVDLSVIAKGTVRSEQPDLRRPWPFGQHAYGTVARTRVRRGSNIQRLEQFRQHHAHEQQCAASRA
jgi:hypothetical protein